MMNDVIVRDEMINTTLNLGGRPIDLTDYATTGLRVVAIGPSGSGKTNAALLVCEQLVDLGWVAIMVDPEGELRRLYGEPVASPEDLADKLKARTHPVMVVDAVDAEAFVPYGEAMFKVCDVERKPVVLMVDESQLFSAPRAGSGKGSIKDATDILNDVAQRGRKRSIDLVVTAQRYTNSISRTLFGSMNLTLVGQQTDATTWSSLSPLFRSHRVSYGDLTELNTGEFFCISRSGLDKLRAPLAEAMAKVALKGRSAKKTLPANFAQWDRAMSGMPTARLMEITDEIIEFLGAIAGLTPAQLQEGRQALVDELGSR